MTTAIATVAALPLSTACLDSLQAGVRRFAEELRLLPQADFPLIEFVAAGRYYRAILIRKGLALVGKRHRGPCENICIGDLAVTTDSGVHRLTGFHRIWSQGGTQRAGVAIEDTIWVCIHDTAETDLAKMEALFTYPPEWEALPCSDDANSVSALLASNAAMKPTPEGELPWLGSL